MVKKLRSLLKRPLAWVLLLMLALLAWVGISNWLEQSAPRYLVTYDAPEVRGGELAVYRLSYTLAELGERYEGFMPPPDMFGPAPWHAGEPGIFAFWRIRDVPFSVWLEHLDAHFSDDVGRLFSIIYRSDEVERRGEAVVIPQGSYNLAKDTRADMRGGHIDDFIEIGESGFTLLVPGGCRLYRHEAGAAPVLVYEASADAPMQPVFLPFGNYGWDARCITLAVHPVSE